MSGSPMKNPTGSLGTRRDGVRRCIAPGLSIADRSDTPCSYLIESGVLAVSVSVDRTPLTCVELLGAGTLIGFQTAPGSYTASYRAISSVELLEVPLRQLREAMQRDPVLHESYLHQLWERIAHTELVAACNAHHSLSERCARWLLRLHAQLGALLPVTHAFLATMLGVRRAGISVTLENMQRGGLIRQRRGSIEILDAAALRANACPCPDGAITPACAISAELIDADPVSRERPRAWLEQAAKTESPKAVSGDDGWARREAALQLCRSIVAKGLTLLEP
jgi:CRP-like cAMP-binding protein